jgi:AcrR family transcriptional regulator
VANESIRLSFRRHLRAEAIRAAHALTVEKGWDRVRVAEVAALIGVSRPTLYKEFGDKQGLGDALVLDEAQRFLRGIAVTMDAHNASAEEAISAAVRFTLDEAAASPLLKAVLTAPSTDSPRYETGVLPLLPTSSSIHQLASKQLVAWLGEHFPHLDTADVVDAVDSLIRLTISHLVLPSSDGVEAGRRISEVALRYLGLGRAHLGKVRRGQREGMSAGM